MEEKIIIKSEQYNIKKFCKRAYVVAGISLALGLLLYMLNYGGCRWTYSSYFDEVWTHSIFENMYLFTIPGLLIDLGLLVSIVMAFVSWWLSSFELTITDKRVFGRASFGKRVDLPLDSVSAVATGWLKGVAVATSSGRIVFQLVKNRDEIYKAVNELLIKRQNKSSVTPEKVEIVSQSTADELKKFKELLDADVITQEEFDQKKKQLLGL